MKTDWHHGVVTFHAVDLATALASLAPDEIDRLDFGVIGFDRAGVVRVYNRYESVAAGLTVARTIGKDFFHDVAPCMNNFMVAERFRQAALSGEPLDATLDYVVTLRMRPTRVRLRLLQLADTAFAYVLVQRLVA